MTRCQISDLQRAEDGLTCQPTVKEFTWPAIGLRLPKSEEVIYQLCIYQFPIGFYVLGGTNSLVKAWLTFVSRFPFPWNVLHVTSPYGCIHSQSSVLCAVPPSADWQLQRGAAKLLKNLEKNLWVGPRRDLVVIRVCRVLSFLWLELHLVFWICVGYSALIISNLAPQQIFHYIFHQCITRALGHTIPDCTSGLLNLCWIPSCYNQQFSTDEILDQYNAEAIQS